MKKILIIVCLVCICICGCTNKSKTDNSNKGTDTTEYISTDDVEFSAIVTDDGILQYTIKNQSQAVLSYSTYISVYYSDNGSWTEIKPLENVAFEDIIKTINSGKEAQTDINLEKMYGSLDAGLYKLEKEVQFGDDEAGIVSAEFEIK